MADETAAPGPAASGEAAAAPADDGRVAALTTDLAEVKDKLLRLLAEMENLRRRTERDVADARQYAAANFARDVLTVADNLRRAIAAVPPEARSADPALSNLMDGVEATERSLEQSLTKHGIHQIAPKGQKFDPSLHQAIYEVATADLAPGMVAEVVQAGYTIGERVLRPAMVAVSKPAASPQPPAANDDAPPTASEPEPAEQT
jgi:molecular chaperone GrpE